MKQEELEKLKVKDVIAMPDFIEELKRQVDLEESSNTEALKKGRLKRTPLDSLRDKGVFNAEKLAQLFESILKKTLLGFGANERQYIYSLCMLAFSRVMVKLQKGVEKE